MKTSRFSIGGLMIVIVVIALDLGFLRWAVSRPMGNVPFVELIAVGVLPMGLVLQLCLLMLIRSRRGRGRPFWLGFEVFGAAATLLVFLASCLATRWLHDGVGDLCSPIRESFGQAPFLATIFGVFLLPQIAVALVGACLLARYRVRLIVERRSVPGFEAKEAGGSSVIDSVTAPVTSIAATT